MAKPTIEFTAIPYEINGHTGYRPQLESQSGILDLDFCKEVVENKRLQTSPNELLHDIEMLAEVATTKVAADGRPRGITKLLKWNRFAKGNLESPTSAWNDTCRAYIKPQLMSDATKEIDATFTNVNSGINVKLNYVAWLGAQTVTNVVKVGKSFAAYGNHMEWLNGDSASLIVGTTSYPLTCTESDVAHAVFSWPSGLAPEAGTQAIFILHSRGGIEEGEVYTNKKTVTIIAADPTGPIQLLKVKEGTREDNIVFFTSSVVNITTANLTGGFQEGDQLLFRATIDGTVDETYCTDCVSASSENHIEMNNGFTNLSQHQSTEWNGKAAKCVLIRDGVEYTCDCTFQQAS